ncbi:MAG: dephospho-CoA kinase [Hyphomicrobiaceae bacterium]
MLIIGLTGSIGMGKSTVAKRFVENGIPVCDADAEVHKLYAANGAAVAPIEAAFPGVAGADGVDRAKLAQHLMRDPEGFKRLEAIVHPLVWEAERAFLAEQVAKGEAMAVLEIPLLFEGKGHTQVDVKVVVSAPAHLQRQRVLERPGMTEEKLAQILSRQVPDAEKRARADFVVDTGLPINETLAQVDKVIDELRGLQGTAYDRCWT